MDTPTKTARSVSLTLFMASNRNLISRLITAGAVVLAAVPVMPWRQPIAWLASVLGLLVVEHLVIRHAERPQVGAADARAPHRVTRRVQLMTALSSVNYSAIVVMLWATGNRVAEVFAVTLCMVVTLYFLLLYYSRLNILVCAIAPLLGTAVAGIGLIVWQAFGDGTPWVALTAAMALAIAVNYFLGARKIMELTWSALRRARAEAVERGVAAEDASQAKSAFLAAMSHEIRTPLNGVLGMAQAMAADRLSARQRGRVEVIHKSGEALLAVLNDILDFSKIEAGKLDLEEIEFDLQAVARASQLIFAEAAREKGLTLDLEVAADAEGVYLGDPSRVGQILNNLISNALKFTDQGEVRVTIDRPEGVLRLAVWDTGEGVSPEQLSRLFDRFMQADASTTRRFGGTGLGLAICHDLAALMGGGIAAASRLGEGSTFTVTLPLARVGDVQPAQAQPRAQAAPAGGRKLRILAAEDNPMNQLVLKTLLEQAGVAAVMVADGREAVEAWRGQAWDVIFMDVQMPVMDGVDATRAIRA
ncbi:MAG: ATP-binding protein, partial [Phenylobacterium sp.]